MDWLNEEEIEDDYIPERKTEIEIPNFLKRKEEILPTEEQLMANAMLNNVPNNTDIEKQNHLNELERACQNWDDDEWHSVIVHASSIAMTNELERRLKVMESYINNTRSNMAVLESQKL